MSHKSSFGPLCPQSDPGGQKASVPQLPACPCQLSILLEAPGCRSQQGELEKWPPCLPWKAWEGSSLRNLPPLVLLLTERTGVEQFVEQGYFFCITLIQGWVGYTPWVDLSPSFGGSALSLNWRSSHRHSRLLAGGSLYHCHYHNWRLLCSIAPAHSCPLPGSLPSPGLPAPLE